MIADVACRDEISALINETMNRLSKSNSDLGELFTHPDMTIVGSRIGEYYQGQESVQALATSTTTWGFTWTCEDMTVWREGEVAWAQIVLAIKHPPEENDEIVSYRITGVFALDKDGWHWRHWGGSQPREEA